MTLLLVRSLVGWLPRSATWVGVVSGPLVVLGYLVGSIPYAHLLSTRRLRQQLDGERAVRPTGEDPLDVPGIVPAAVAAGLAALVMATVAWDVGLATTPGSAGSANAGNFSSIGVYSNQVLGAWVSVALWTGLGVVVGHLAPVWTGFRGGSGLPPAVALVVAYAPLVFAGAALIFVAANAASGRPRTALLVALPVAVATEYMAWLADVQSGWGVTNGPELAVWVTVVAGALFARNLRPSGDRPL